MMPPKKSKAARGAGQEVTPPTPTPAVEQNGTSASADESKSEVNVFNVEVLYDKRKRNLPAGEEKLQDWLKDNFETKENQELVIQDMYDEYLSTCVSSGGYAVGLTPFMKAVKESYPNGIGVQEGSPHVAGIRVKKPRKEHSKGPKKVQADTFKIKMKEILERALTDLGGTKKNPVRFHSIKQFVTAKFPALRVDLRPNLLMSGLNRGIWSGKVELVKGIGKSGYYRIPLTKEELEAEEEERKAARKVKKEKATEDKSEGEGDSEEKEEKGEDEAEDGEGDDGRKRKSESDTKEPEAKKKKSKRKPAKKHQRTVVHSDPKIMEDTFYLALTYSTEPKQASIRKILNYINKYYDDALSQDKLKKALDSGAEKGYWDQVSSQSYELLFQEFDPTADDDLVGMVTNAITACSEPKVCSVSTLKQYVVDYHSEYRVADRPHVFKKALERAEAKRILRRLTGIGASGSISLAESFVPSPIVLSGKDQAGDYSSSEEEADFGATVEGGYRDGFNLDMFKDKYVPRPSKRHARDASKGIKEEDLSAIAQKGGGRLRHTKARDDARKPKRKASSKRPMKEESSSEEDSDSEDEDSEEEPQPVRKRAAPAPKRKAVSKAALAKKKPAASKGRSSATGRQSPRKAQKASYAEASGDESEVDDYASVRKVPRPSKKGKGRGGRAAARATPKSTKRQMVEDDSEEEEEKEEEEEEEEEVEVEKEVKGKGRGGRAAAKTTPKSAKRQKVEDDDEEEEEEKEEEKEEEEEEEEVEKEVKGKGRGGRAAAKATPKSAKRQKVEDDDEEEEEKEEEEEEEEEVEKEVKGKGRGGRTPAKATPKSARKQKVEEVEEEEEEEKIEVKTPKGRGRRDSTPKKIYKDASDDDADSDVSAEIPVLTKKSTPRNAVRGGRRSYREPESEAESEKEEPTPKARGRTPSKPQKVEEEKEDDEDDDAASGPSTPRKPAAKSKSRKGGRRR